jgi:phosphate transport system substrate-binding protein
MCLGIGIAANLGASGSVQVRLEAERLARNGFLASWLPFTAVLLLAWPDWSWWYWSGVEDQVGLAFVLGVVLEVGGFWLGGRASQGRSPPVIKRMLLATAGVYVCLLILPWPWYSHVGSAEQFRAGAAVPMWKHWPLLGTLVVGGAWMFGVLAATAVRLYKIGAVSLSLLLCAPLLLGGCSQPSDRAYVPEARRQVARAPVPEVAPRKARGLVLAVSYDAETLVRGWTVARSNEFGVPKPELVVRDEGQAITALIDGRVDAALLHRMPNDAEERYSRGDGMVARTTLSAEPIAHCAVVLVVHPENPVEAISIEKALGILSGEVQDWAQVAELEGRVQLYAGERSASTYVATEELLDGTPFSERLQTMPSDRGVSRAVGSDHLGVGLGSASSAQGVKVLGIRGIDGKVRPYLPSDPGVPESMLNRHLYLVVRSEPDAKISALRDFALSKSGVAIGELNSYVVEQSQQ